MSTSNTVDSSLAAVREDLASLRRDVMGLMDHLKASATNGARSTVSDLDEGARQLYRAAASEGDRSAKAISRQIEEQPLLALAIAAGIGYIGGRVFSR